MSAEAAALVRSFPVGQRTVTLTIPKPKRGGLVHMTAEWFPDRPARLNRQEWRQYRRGRAAVLAALARIANERAVLEV